MKLNYKKCNNCGKNIRLSNFKRHYDSCIKYKKEVKSIKSEWKNLNGKYNCPYCNKEYSKMGISTHIWRKHEDGINFVNKSANNKFKINHIPWNKGLTKKTDERVKNSGNLLSNRIKNGEISPPFLGKHHTEKTKKVLSYKRSINNKGGKCKWYEYKKKNGNIVKLQGTWEIRFAKVLDILDENWIKPGANGIDNGHSFIWKDKELIEHYYTPDFWSPKLETYFEVKGYWWGKDKEKMKYIIEQYKDITIKIIKKEELKMYEKLLVS